MLSCEANAGLDLSVGGNYRSEPLGGGLETELGLSYRFWGRDAKLGQSANFLNHFKKAHPTQFRELALMGMEHVLPFPARTEPELQDCPLGLREHGCVGVLLGAQQSAGSISPKESRMKME